MCLYLHRTLQYRVWTDLKLGKIDPRKHIKNVDDTKEVNSKFVEIEKHSSNSRRNIFVGCVTYRPSSYPIQEFNKLLSETLDILQNENKCVI